MSGSGILTQARERLAHERDRRAQQSVERLPPSPTRAEADAGAHGWTGWSPAPASESTAQPVADMTARRELLAQERARWKRAAEPRQLPPAGTTWRPTPTAYENQVKAANPAAVTMLKIWDGLPIDPWAFDPTPGPSPGPPPVNLTPPSIVPITGDNFEVGDQLAGQGGTWSGSPTYSRVWRRDGAAIPGQTNPGYTLIDGDVGAMIGLTVIAANPNGAATADAVPIGPVIPAAPLAKAAKPRK
jgi:hypothetical protein